MDDWRKSNLANPKPVRILFQTLLAWGFLRIICFENRFELGTIKTDSTKYTYLTPLCHPPDNQVLI